MTGGGRGRGLPGGLVTTGMSILVALVIWIAAIDSRTFEVGMRVPALPPDLPDSLVISGPFVPESVTVVFSGSGADILSDQLAGSPEGVATRLDSLPEEGFPVSVAITLSPELVTWRGRPFTSPGGAAFQPAQMICTIDRVMTDTLPVKVMARGAVPARYFWAVSEPGRVSVAGPADAISRTDSARTMELIPGQPLQAVDMAPGAAYGECFPSEVRAALIPPPPLLEVSGL